MKLVYLWVDNYKGKISKQGFSFSSEYAVSFNDDKGILYINKNPNYIKDFWGKNILDVSAIVGENGSGKTTVAKCVYDLCGGIVPVDSWSKESVSKRVVVYLNEECGQTNKEQTMTVFFFWDKKISVEISPIDLLKVKCIDLYEIDKEQYLMAMKEHDMTATYFTNSFEASHITKNQGMTEYSEGDIRKTLCFSPMLSLNRGRISLRENYGAQLDSKGGLLDGIEKYAQQMCNDFKAAYISSNGYNFLMALRHCPGAIVNNLPVLRDFEVSITEFGEYLAYKKDWIRMNEFDKSVYFVRKNIYEHISKKMRKTIWADIYINILCEIALFLNVFNLTYKVIDFDLLEVEGIRMESADAFDFILNQIPNDDERIKEKNLTTRIRNVSSIDIDILEDFLELKSKRTCILSDTKWFLQVKHFTNSYNKLKNIQVNYTINDGYLEFIDLLEFPQFYPQSPIFITL